MARTKLKPLFTTDTRTNSKTADKSRTFTGVEKFGAGGPAFTFLNVANERNKKIDGGFNALTYPEFGNAADGGHAIVFKINRAVPSGGTLKEFLPGFGTKKEFTLSGIKTTDTSTGVAVIAVA